MLAAVAFAVLPVRIKELVYGNVQQDDIIFLGNFILAQHSAGILFKYGRCS